MEDSVETRLSVHEAVCAQRYERINESLDAGKKRMRHIEILIYITIAAVLLGPGAAAEFAKKLLGL
jgi:predicted nucleic acid-binding Zn ribbon protein